MLSLPAEIWQQIVLYTDFDVIQKLSLSNKKILDYTKENSFWIGKFKYDDFSLFVTENYPHHYQLMIKARDIAIVTLKIVKVEMANGENGIIDIDFYKASEEFNEIDYAIIPDRLKIIKEGYYPKNVHIVPVNDYYCAEYRIRNQDFENIEKNADMTDYEVINFLTNIEYVGMADLIDSITVCDNDECFYYDDDGYTGPNISANQYPYAIKFFRRQGIRQALQYYK